MDNVTDIYKMNVSTPTTAGYDDLFQYYGTPLIFLPLLMAIGIPGNLIVLYIYSTRWSASTFSLFVRVLAAIDLTSCLVAMPLILAKIAVVNHPEISLYNAVKSTANYLSYVVICASGSVLFIIACDRYLKICRPQRKSITIKVAKILCGIVCIISLLINTFVFMDKSDESVASTESEFSDVDEIEQGESGSMIAIIHIALVVVMFAIISISMAVLYTLVWHRLKCHARELRKSSSGNAKSAEDNAARTAVRTSKIFSAVTALFFLSITPHFIAFTLLSVEPQLLDTITPIGAVFLDLAYYSPFVNSVANPFIYSFTSPQFRVESKKMMRTWIRTCLGLAGKKGRFLVATDTVTTPQTHTGVAANSRDTSEDLVDMSESGVLPLNPPERGHRLVTLNARTDSLSGKEDTTETPFLVDIRT